MDGWDLHWATDWISSVGSVKPLCIPHNCYSSLFTEEMAVSCPDHFNAWKQGDEAVLDEKELSWLFW